MLRLPSRLGACAGALPCCKLARDHPPRRARPHQHLPGPFRLESFRRTTRKVVLVLLVVLALHGGGGGSGAPRFAVVFDAGSTGSRIHVFKFTQGAGGHLELDSDTFEQLKPGLSSYADDAKAGAQSLAPLLKVALEAVPPELQVRWDVRLLHAIQLCALYACVCASVCDLENRGQRACM